MEKECTRRNFVFPGSNKKWTLPKDQECRQSFIKTNKHINKKIYNYIKIHENYLKKKLNNNQINKIVLNIKEILQRDKYPTFEKHAHKKCQQSKNYNKDMNIPLQFKTYQHVSKKNKNEKTTNTSKNEMNYLINHFKNQNFCKSYEILQTQKKELEQIIITTLDKNNINDYLKKLNKNEKKITNFINYFEKIITKKNQTNYLYYDKKYIKQTNDQIYILLKILSQIVHLLKGVYISENKKLIYNCS
ncbi:conserved Plasmodium protein, unknown function [Plasmodium vinckei vinckei]|uniref:Uncharacterized protein n=1 Tax=Plasmodium vinckei vinckei TaxID=54757 RepID=A0A449BUB1_PLAVN|nr:conserved Plasmodium protein, unknown function [Plasmodium vinckei vinckei]KEG03191.1 hypothetical protein YYE_02125 [Plasmodium vinckei vinckei]VEV56998.1 conserved Plasmodium protein, unknown function [Plasmodium vinckei vinckei]